MKASAAKGTVRKPGAVKKSLPTNADKMKFGNGNGNGAKSGTPGGSGNVGKSGTP